MDAKKNGTDNPFADTYHSLEWISTAMDAARRHKEKLQDPPPGVYRLEEHRPGRGKAR